MEAIIRETKEETGLTIYEKDLIPIFQMHRHGYMGYTYLTDHYKGEIQTDEDHVVRWDIFNEITHSSAPFGEWNRLVAESMVSMGLHFDYYYRKVGDKIFY